MARGESGPRAWALIDEIRLTVQNLNPTRKPGRYSTSKVSSASTTWLTQGGTGWWKPSRVYPAYSGSCW